MNIQQCYVSGQSDQSDLKDQNISIFKICIPIEK